MLDALIIARTNARIKELIYGDSQKGDYFEKYSDTRTLAFVLNVDNGAICSIKELCKLLLCPPFLFPLTLDFHPKRKKVYCSFIMVHFISPKSYSTFQVFNM